MVKRGAENGQLTIMWWRKTQRIIKCAKPVLDVYSRHHQLLGDVGAGQLAKMMNQNLYRWHSTRIIRSLTFLVTKRV